jgi:hypothetical protein
MCGPFATDNRGLDSLSFGHCDGGCKEVSPPLQHAILGGGSILARKESTHPPLDL